MGNNLEQLGAATAGIVHDLNNQLMLVINHLELGNAAGAKRAAANCSALTASILDYCKGTAESSAKISALHLESFLAEFTDTLSVPPHIQLRLRVDSAVPVFADRHALTRALHNLVSNAFSFMPQAGVLTLALSGAELSVSDTGPGIPLEAQARIFEPFYTTRKEGTGLGLAIVRDIMLRNGGSVILTSTPGQGATFTLRFRQTQA